MNPKEKDEVENDPMTSLKARRSVLARVQILKNRYGFPSGEKFLIAAMDLYEEQGGNGNGRRQG